VVRDFCLRTVHPLIPLAPPRVGDEVAPFSAARQSAQLGRNAFTSPQIIRLRLRRAETTPGSAGGFQPAPKDPCEPFSRARFLQLRIPPFRYPISFRVHYFGPLCVHRVPEHRTRNSVHPFPTPRLQAAQFASFGQYHERTKTSVGPPRTLPLSVECEYLSDSLCSLHFAGKSVVRWPGRGANRGTDTLCGLARCPWADQAGKIGAPVKISFPGRRIKGQTRCNRHGFGPLNVAG